MVSFTTLLVFVGCKLVFLQSSSDGLGSQCNWLVSRTGVDTLPGLGGVTSTVLQQAAVKVALREPIENLYWYVWRKEGFSET